MIFEDRPKIADDLLISISLNSFKTSSLLVFISKILSSMILPAYIQGSCLFKANEGPIEGKNLFITSAAIYLSSMIFPRSSFKRILLVLLPLFDSKMLLIVFQNFFNCLVLIQIFFNKVCLRIFGQCSSPHFACPQRVSNHQHYLSVWR